jgi:hypothetical protein
MEAMRPMSIQHKGRRYRLKFRSAGDDIHPLPLLRRSFEQRGVNGDPGARVMKDIVMQGGVKEFDSPISPGLALLYYQ